MNRYRFPLAVAATSLALVGILAVAAVLTVRSALAVGPWAGGPPWAGGAGWAGGPPWAGGPHAFNLPPELEGLRDLPPAERFAHFNGAQIRLTDKDNNPITLNATPGTVTAVSAGSLSLTANDGTTKNFTLNDETMIRGKAARGGARASQANLAQNDKVVVLTMNDSSTANAVVVGGADGFGPHRFGR